MHPPLPHAAMQNQYPLHEEKGCQSAALDPHREQYLLTPALKSSIIVHVDAIFTIRTRSVEL